MVWSSKDNTDEVNVEELMKTIHARMERKATPSVVAHSSTIMDTQLKTTKSMLSPQGQSDLVYISKNCYVNNTDYMIFTHRKIIGPALVQGRRLVNGEVKRYVDTIVSRQNEINARTVNLIKELSTNTASNNTLNSMRFELSEELSHKIDALRSEIAGTYDIKLKATLKELSSNLTSQLNQQNDRSDTLQTDLGVLKSTVEVLNDRSNTLQTDLIAMESATGEFSQKIDSTRADILHDVDNKIGCLKAGIDQDISENVRSILLAVTADLDNKAWLAGILDSRIQKDLNRAIPNHSEPTDVGGSDINYFLFEEKFRGSSDDIRHRQQSFIKYYSQCKNVLDIGCGRGEFLELLKENGIEAKGIDIDDSMLDYCKSRGLSVEKADALTYLEHLEDKSLDGIFIDQVVEHLESDYLIRMLKLCFDKLKFGYYLFIETVNPLSYTSMANFYIDLSHKRPVHPETLKYLMAAIGFRQVNAQFLAPVHDEGRLRTIDANLQGMTGAEAQIVSVYNYNIEKLNGILFGAQDYFVVGKK